MSGFSVIFMKFRNGWDSINRRPIISVVRSRLFKSMDVEDRKRAVEMVMEYFRERG